MVYFMTELPSEFVSRFSYPKPPSLKNLKELSNSFLNSILIYIKKEISNLSSDDIDKYSLYVRDPFKIHNDLCDILTDLDNIFFKKYLK